MVAGHLQEKNGIYYVVLTYKTYDGKRKTKWQSTGLPIKGNKRRAEAMMRELQDDFEPPVDPNGPPSKAMLFADYLVQWLEIAKSTVKLTTYASYKELSNSRIIPYFRNLGVTLGDLKAVHIQAFYQEQLERVKPNTVIHYHAVIHRALKYAVKTDLINVNPADKVDRPKKNEFTGNFYSKDEMNALFDAVRGSKIEVAVMLTAFYGLRRSEVVGLKWAAVDFEQNTIEICHTVTTVRLDGKEVLVESNGTKTKSSKRTLPLVPVFRERLLALQEEQKENRKYNEGMLVGEWVKLPTTEEEMQKVFERIGIGKQDDFGQPYEEWFITDYECPIYGVPQNRLTVGDKDQSTAPYNYCSIPLESGL